jgi:hypothetical protein
MTTTRTDVIEETGDLVIVRRSIVTRSGEKTGRWLKVEQELCVKEQVSKTTTCPSRHDSSVWMLNPILREISLTSLSLSSLTWSRGSTKAISSPLR